MRAPVFDGAPDEVLKQLLHVHFLSGQRGHRGLLNAGARLGERPIRILQHPIHNAVEIHPEAGFSEPVARV
jgi:hypothetical protein